MTDHRRSDHGFALVSHDGLGMTEPRSDSRVTDDELLDAYSHWVR